MGVVVKDGQEWRDHCQLMQNGSWVSSELLPCVVQKGITHILHKGNNHFVMQLPGLLSLVGDCELIGDMEISNTHLVVFKHADVWQIRMINNDPASMLNLPYITATRGKVQMASHVVQWGMARHNGIPALLRQFREGDMLHHLASFQSLHGIIKTSSHQQPPLSLIQLAVEGRATCRFGMKPTELKLAQQSPCLALVRLQIKKVEGEDPGNFHVLPRNGGVCTANIESTTCHAEPSLLVFGGTLTEIEIRLFCPTMAGKDCVSTSCLNLGDDRTFLNWGVHYVNAWNEYFKAAAASPFINLGGFGSGLFGGLRGGLLQLFSFAGIEGWLFKVALLFFCYLAATRACNNVVVLGSITVGALLILAMIPGSLAKRPAMEDRIARLERLEQMHGWNKESTNFVHQSQTLFAVGVEQRGEDWLL